MIYRFDIRHDATQSPDVVSRISGGFLGRLVLKLSSVLLFSLVMAWPQQAFARMECGQVTPTFSLTQDPANYSGPRTAGSIIGRGTITVTVSCTGSRPTTGYPQLIIIGADRLGPRQSGMSGVLLKLNGAPSQTFTNGCILVNHQEGGGYFSWNFYRTPESGSAACSITGSIEVVFTLDGNPVGGTNVWGGVHTRVSDWQNDAAPDRSYPGVPDILLSNTIPVSVSLNTTCNVTTTAIAITLPTISTSSLPTSGATAGMTPFKINLSGCTFPATPGVPYTAHTTFSFTQGGAANLIANVASVPAANVRAQILTSNLTPLESGWSIATAITAAGSYDIPLYARYIATGQAGPGQYSGQVAFSLSYM